MEAMDDRNATLIAEALDRSADEDAWRARVEALVATGEPNVLMLAIAMTYAASPTTRRLGAEVLAGLAASSGPDQLVSAAQGRLLELIGTEGDPGVMRVVIGALREAVAEADAEDAGAAPPG